MDYLDSILSPKARVPSGASVLDSLDYDPSYDEAALLPGMEHDPYLDELARYSMGQKAIGEKVRQSKEAREAMPDLLALDPENPLFSGGLNKIFSRDPDAITNPRVANILGLKERLAKHPEFTAEDITDPELLTKYQARESQGMDWRKNRQQFAMDQIAKQRRLELRAAGASPDQLREVMDPKTGFIGDDDYAGIKYHLAANQKQPMSQQHAEKLAELETAAEREPTPEEKLAYLKVTYPKIPQAQLTTSHWEEAYNALTPKRNVLKHYLKSLVHSGVAVDPEMLAKYNIAPVVTRWDPKGKKVLVSGAEAPKVLVNENQDADAIAEQLMAENRKKMSSDAGFRAWKAKNAPNDSGHDYDLYSAYLDKDLAHDARGHGPDTYKLPNHPTFSDQSKYSTAEHPGGHWGEDGTYTPSAWMASDANRMKQLQEYMKKVEPDVKLIMPPIQVHTQEQYDALAKGSVYVDSNGKRWRKN